MESNDDKRRQLIERAIAAGGAIDAASSGAWLRLWQPLSIHLSPLIGESGFAALFRRTIRLVSTEHDWLGSTQASSTPGELLAVLGVLFDEVDPAMAREANAALLSIFTKLLSGLIGEALTIRLLEAAWAGSSGKAEEHT